MTDQLTIEQTPDKQRLKRVLGLPSVVAYGLASMGLLAVFTVYGAGVEITDGHLPAAYAIAVCAVLLTAHSYGRMASAIPRSGSSYVFTRHSFGPAVGFLTGWVMLLDYLFLPMVNFLLIGIYMNSVFVDIPSWIFTLGSILLVLALSIIGVKWIGQLNIALAVCSAALVVVFIVLAATHADRLTPEVIFGPLLPGDGGLGPIFAGAAMLAFAFIGFDGISTLAEETKDPAKTIPRATMLSVLIIGIVFFSVAWAGHLIAPDWTRLVNLEAAGTEMMAEIGGPALMTAFLIIYVVATVLCGTAAQMSVSRVLFAMGRDGLLPRGISRLHRRFATPYVAAVIVSVFSLVALFITLDQAVYMINFGALIAFAMVNLSTIKLFWFDQRERGARGILRGLGLPLLGFLVIAYLWTSLAPFTYVLGGAWLAIGVLIFGSRTRWFRSPPPEFSFEENETERAD